MYSSRRHVVRDGQVHRFNLLDGGDALSYAAVLDSWENDESFRSFFLMLLKEVPFSAYRWETPPVTSHNRDQPFEFAIVRDPKLEVAPDPSPFAAHLAEAEADVAVFKNLGGDADLVAPCPQGPETAYGHLASFAREAPASQNHTLWQTVAQVMKRRIGDRPIWLSTAGGGVAWLHVRLDIRPKYYQHRPYADRA